MHILIFGVFLILYVGWIWASAALVKLTNQAILAGNIFWVTELILLVGLVGLFAFIFVLSGYFEWRLVAALFGASQIGVLLSAILGGLLGSPTSAWGPRSAWAGAEFGLKHGPLALGMMAISGLIVIAYPIAVGISYFRLSAADLPPRLFQYTLSLSFLGSLPMLSVFLIGALVSENLDAETRARFFVSQLSGLVPNALWLALLFWSFGKTGDGRKVGIGSMSLEFPPVLLGVLMGFFVLTVVIPYLIGAQRAKQWRTTLLDIRKEWTEKLKDILETPAGAVYMRKLAALQDNLDHGIDEFIGSDRMIAAGIQIDQDSIPPDMAAIAPAYRLTRSYDPRFKHLDWLKEMSEKVGEIRDDLNGLTAEADLEKAANEWSKYLQPRERALTKEAGQTTKMRTPALLILTGVVLPVFSVVLSEFAKWLWVYFSKSLPQ